MTTPNSQTLDVIIIGAGIGGVIVLKEAIRKGLNAIILEKASDIGGLWRDLPEWQDIQTRKEDWAANGPALSSEYQQDVHHNICSYARYHSLIPKIHTEEPVQKATFVADKWEITTSKAKYRSKYLVAASGTHNILRIPKLKKIKNKLQEYHSSQLKDPTILTGKSVTILGAGASAFDLLDLSLENKAKEIHWVYRSSPKWMIPTHGSKYYKTELRGFAFTQMLGISVDKMNAEVQKHLKNKYKYFGISDILPDYPYDYRKHMLIPGRSLMIKNFKSIHRHKGEILEINGLRVKTAQDEFDTEVLLYATGYDIDLKYFNLPEFMQIKTPEELISRCGTYFLSLDYPNLFFFGMSVVDTVGTSPVGYTFAARSIISHILGRSKFPLKPLTDKVNHWDMLKLMAQHDTYSYPKLWWKIKYFLLAYFYSKFINKGIKI